MPPGKRLDEAPANDGSHESVRNTLVNFRSFNDQVSAKVPSKKLSLADPNDATALIYRYCKECHTQFGNDYNKWILHLMGHRSKDFRKATATPLSYMWII